MIDWPTIMRGRGLLLLANAETDATAPPLPTVPPEVRASASRWLTHRAEGASEAEASRLTGRAWTYETASEAERPSREIRAEELERRMIRIESAENFLQAALRLAKRRGKVFHA